MFSLWWPIKTNYIKQVEKGSRPTLGTAPQAVAHSWRCLGTACLEQDCESVCDSAMLHIRFHSSIQTNKQTNHKTHCKSPQKSEYIHTSVFLTNTASLHSLLLHDSCYSQTLFLLMRVHRGAHVYKFRRQLSVSFRNVSTSSEAGSLLDLEPTD